MKIEIDFSDPLWYVKCNTDALNVAYKVADTNLALANAIFFIFGHEGYQENLAEVFDDKLLEEFIVETEIPRHSTVYLEEFIHHRVNSKWGTDNDDFEDYQVGTKEYRYAKWMLKKGIENKFHSFEYDW